MPELAPNNPDLRFERLFAAHQRAIYRFCLRRLERQDAEDACAEVFAIAWRKLEQIPGDELPWLVGVAYRVVGNQFRSRRRRSLLARRLVSERLPSTSEHSTLTSALSALPARDQELLRLAHWDGLTREEMAKALGISENTLDQRMHRARARLRSKLGTPSPRSPLEATNE